MGTRNYRQVTVFLAFELVLENENQFDEKYLAKKLDLCKYLIVL